MDIHNDKILNKYIKNNLTYWKNKELDEQKFLNIIKKYKLKIAYICINNEKVSILKLFNVNVNNYLREVVNFLQDIVKKYNNLKCNLYICISDTLINDNISILNVDTGNEISKDDPLLNNVNFYWGVSNCKKYVRTINSLPIKELNEYYPCFCFERYRGSNQILFPMNFNNNFKNIENKDPYNFKEKEYNDLLFRGFNICCDLNNIDKIKLIEKSYFNNEKYNFKFSSEKKHPVWNEYIISEEHLKLFKSLKIINNEIDINQFRNLFSINNFISLDYIFNHKIITTTGSARNTKWYLSNSIIAEQKFKNKQYFYEDVFEDNEDIFYFFNDTLEDTYYKINSLSDNILENIIFNRKKKFMNYLHYPKLVEWYGLFLCEYNNIFNK
jgi:hypothetical protein